MSLAIKAQAPVYGGYVIARDNGIIFIRGAIPDEIVDVAISEKKRDYSIGVVTNIIEPSPYRIFPPCPVFGICGGCHLQFISYEKQILMKEDILLDSLRRIGGIETSLSPALTGNDYHYRHRAQFKVSPQGKVGFYKEGTREVVAIEKCPLMTTEINLLLDRLSAPVGMLRGIKEIHVSYGDTSVALIKTRTFTEDMENMLIGIFSGIAFENGESIGKDYIKLDLNGLQYTITAWSFFQSNWNLNRKIVELLISELQPLEGMRILDLYAGAGNFSLPIAVHASHVVAVEENLHAIEDGQRNAGLNNIKNCKFIKSSAEKYKTGDKFDTLILDPPRSGLSNEVMRKVIDLSPERICYISCNPATLARDIKKLKEKYDINSIRMVDFFPNTYHVEAVAFLSLR
ncbi:MAG: class I SAM-dependent RNA methyltransferase [Nitrospirae bacterium]|nr:class I SAM-dependent RNA methyltransferase [Nitrospirota bacterium]